MSAMNTFTGRIFDPLKMMKQDVCVEDIAHALSLVCISAIFFRWRSIR